MVFSASPVQAAAQPLNQTQPLKQPLSQPLSIAVAANFAGPLRTLLPAFEHTTGIKTRVTVGSSGALFAQIQHGAPFDVFFSADSKRPQALVSSGRVPADAVMTYAIGQLALVGDVESITSLSAQADTVRVAIADPNLAPYGRAARELMQAAGVWSTLQSRLIRGTNVQQTLQFWQTGNVDAALIAASQCVTYQLNCKPVPPRHAPVIQQMAIVVTDNKASALAARSLAHYLQSAAVQQQLVVLGYRAVAHSTGAKPTDAKPTTQGRS